MSRIQATTADHIHDESEDRMSIIESHRFMSLNRDLQGSINSNADLLTSEVPLVDKNLVRENLISRVTAFK
jgi:hypothetical protein